MEMGERIKYLRKQKDMTLEQLGQRVGVGKSTVRKWEEGEIQNMRRDKIAKLAAALDVTPGYLMGWEEPYTSLGIDKYTKIWTKEFKENLPLVWENTILNADVVGLGDTGYDIEEMNKLVDDIAGGKTEITFTLACEIADKLGVSLDELVGREEYEKTALDYENGLNGLELQLLNLLKQLSPEQKEFLLVQLEALVKRNKGSEETPF